MRLINADNLIVRMVDLVSEDELTAANMLDLIEEMPSIDLNELYEFISDEMEPADALSHFHAWSDEDDMEPEILFEGSTDEIN